MPSLFKISSERKLLTDFLLMLLFGGLSLAFGLIYNSAEGVADFRESPLLIHIFYLKNPLFLIGTCLITAIATPEGASPITAFLIHAIALFAGWFYWKWLRKQQMPHLKRGLSWMGFVPIYYGVLVVPGWIIVDSLLGMPLLSEVNMVAMGLSEQSGFWDIYISILKSAKYEVISTLLITGLYLMELESRKKLVATNVNLEVEVVDRTEELAAANKSLRRLNRELISKNIEVKAMNDNLDHLVKERTKKIEKQLKILSNYAQINSHEVRAPLARILSISQQLNEVPNETDRNAFLRNIQESAEELDEVIRKMNKILTQSA